MTTLRKGYKDIRSDGTVDSVGLDWSIPVNPGCHREETSVVIRRPLTIDEKINHTSIVDLPAKDRRN